MTTLKQLTEELHQFAKERDWEEFHSPKNLSMALAVEASELMEIFMWMKESQIEVLSTKYPIAFQNAKDEMADVLLYLLRMADILKIDLLSACAEKMKKNAVKYPVEKGRELARILKGASTNP